MNGHVRAIVTGSVVSLACAGNEPVSMLGAWRNAHGQHELDDLFTSLAASFTACTSRAATRLQGVGVCLLVRRSVT